MVLVGTKLVFFLKSKLYATFTWWDSDKEHFTWQIQLISARSQQGMIDSAD